ncbi:M61 family metallopeptidase [Pontibacter pudoricolor]|uniref:M61 family metallopeptidase n=1 Tax=Pontibacter pudoricolor TaxID=2694930 RepID=UPI001EE481FB|nr:peptidase M61 [Pontibacter pudoricolor]
MISLNKSLLLLCLGISFSFSSLADEANSKYAVTIHLTEIKDDKVKVTLQAPAIFQDEIVYNMPKMVPGTYAISDFGKFLTQFEAFDRNGNTLKVERLDVNRWKILNAKTLHQLTYWVDDSFDTPRQEDIIFEPAGTNIQENENFLLNTYGFVGYFDGMKQVPFELTVQKPEGFYGSTSLQAISSTKTSDKFSVTNYMQLADSPLMYNMPDTTVVFVGNTEVLVSLYNPTGNVTSKPIAANVQDILQAQRTYLGGTLPVEKYAFLIYVSEEKGKSGGFGALEHSYSSVYFLPEMPSEKFSAQIRDIASHEFFHIVTPLSIHSEEIGDFDFINPKMSKHLWLYEGVTEYFASHVQAFEKLMPVQDYLERLKEYIYTSRRHYNDTLPFTEMSSHVLTKYAREYGNVYQKGALIGMVLDIRLRELSGGMYGLRDLLQDLSTTYGKDHAFKDEELFDQIAALTAPEIREFFTRYVEGNEPLPLQETFLKVGISYKPALKTVNTIGGFIPSYDTASGTFKIPETASLDHFGITVGFKPGDQLLAVNGTSITKENIHQLLGAGFQKEIPGNSISFVVGRKYKSGNVKERKLRGKVTTVDREDKPVLMLLDNATDKQVTLRNTWLNI